ncbi:protein FAM47B-like isoform X1 [Gopherus flavomarginatus]|uniref:protein FAM47B-like isoform X1 n=1 Tax=Gopherus flavomarginatus TaxID=286002 RepID=UPI0021CBEEF0|nr:protein FAM47B-like isoform X1 [Gopherus flavomarginatus]
MPSKYFQERNKRKFSDSLNSQRWRFLKSGLDDFRSGFPPPSDNIISCGTKGPVPIVLRNRASDASRMAQQKGRKKCTKTQVSPSKLSPLQKARRDHIAQTEHCLSQHPLALYPHLEESIPPELFKEVVGILDPEMCLNSEGQYKDCDQDSHTPQQVLYQPEDGKSKEACPRPSALSKESKGKNPQYTYLSKKEVAAREKEASLSYDPPLDENVKRVTKEFCDWVDSLGGEKYKVDEATILSLFDTGYETKLVLSVPIHVVELNNVPAELRKYMGVSPPPTAVKSPLQNSCRPCLAKDPSQPKWEKIRFGAWYLEPKTWRKQRANEPLEDPNTAMDTVQNLRNQFSEKEAELMQLHGTHAFKEFLETKGYRKPEFLLQMLAAGDVNGAQERTSKGYKKDSLKRPEGIREGSSSTIVN